MSSSFPGRGGSALSPTDGAGPLEAGPSSPQITADSRGISLDMTEQAAGSLPRKGILKRPSMRAEQANRDAEQPLRQYRESPDRFPDKPLTRIPKLSVTWWEKNAVNVFGDTSDENNTDSEQPHMMAQDGMRQTAILDSEEESSDAHAAYQYEQEEQFAEMGDRVDEPFDHDDSMSVASSTASTMSNVVGRWWVGKDTRFVPHCVKRGCNHSGHNHGQQEYLTPTQRLQKEIAELRKHLKRAEQERDEKDKYLQEMRKRIDELDTLHEKGFALSEGSKMLERRKESDAALEKEKKSLEKRHAVRVNQLIAETVAAREENMSLVGKIADLEKRLSRRATLAETATMTDPVIIAHEASPARDAALSPMPSPQPPLSPMSPMSGSQYLSQETLNQLQAYQNEAFIWRNKAAQLEICIKDQLLKAAATEQQLRLEYDQLSVECNQMRQILVPEELVDSLNMADSGIENAAGSPVHIPSPRTPVECNLISCIERKKQLIDENNKLIETTDDLVLRSKELEEDCIHLRKDLEKGDQEINRMRANAEQIAQEFEAKKAEIAAAHLVISRLQGETEQQRRALSYLEERQTAYRNTILDHDLVVPDEQSDAWRRGVADPRYRANLSKCAQTELTAEALSKNEDEFNDIQIKLKALHADFSSKRSDLHGRFEEIEKNLLIKTQLVDTLTHQLEEVRKEQRQQFEQQQAMREEHTRQANALAREAEKVPHLQTVVDQLQSEACHFDLQLAAAKEEYDQALCGALDETMKKYTDQSKYWKEKLAVAEQHLVRARNENAQLLKEREEARLKWKVERTDLEQRLTSSIQHVSQLNTELTRPTRDAECEARPRCTSKYVACRPNTKSKTTQIVKGDLFDEQDERLRLCQGELHTTKKQVHALQKKIINEQMCPKSSIFSASTAVSSVDTTLDDRPAMDEEVEHQLQMLETRNCELREKLNTLEEEKSRMMKSEKERIQQLVNEFDNVRKELDQEMGRYDSEKKWLKGRISYLEKRNKELERTVSQLRPIDKPMQAIPEIRVEDETRMDSLRKTLSEPELREGDDELMRLRVENARLASELLRVRESIRRTASVASAASRRSNRSQLSPAFANLADDLNTVKNDLEHMLNRMDSEESTTPRVVLSRAGSEEAPQSEILERVLADLEEGERDKLARDLKRSRAERDSMRVKMSQLQRDLREAWAELEVYRREGIRPRSTERDSERRRVKKRSYSVVDITRETFDKEEAKRWKQQNGVMFRELQHMRNDLSAALADRRDLRVQIAMIRGELELAKCQIQGGTLLNNEVTACQQQKMECDAEKMRLKKERSLTAPPPVPTATVTVTPSAPSPAPPPVPPHGAQPIYDVPNDDGERKSRRGSVCERVSLTVRAASVEAPRQGRKEEKGRSSEKPKARSTSRDNKDKREPVRKRKKSTSRTDAVPPLPLPPTRCALAPSTSEPQLHAKSIAACMSASWHADSFHPGGELESDDVIRRRTQRVVSLREKTARLQRENKELTEQLESIKAHQASKGRDESRARIVALERANRELESRLADRGEKSRLLADENKAMQRQISELYAEIKKQEDGSHSDARAGSAPPEYDEEKEQREKEKREEMIRREKMEREMKDKEQKMAVALEQASKEKEQLAREKEQLEKEQEQKFAEEMEKMRKEKEQLIQEKEELEKEQEEKIKVQSRLALAQREIEMYEQKVRDFEKDRQDMYLVMFKKGQQAAHLDIDEARTVDDMTQDKVVLRFLHDAFFYFLTNKGDSKEHLQAMMTMLNFTNEQKETVAKRRGGSH